MITKLTLLCLLPLLGDDVYTVREAAHAAVYRLPASRETYEILARQAVGHPDPEVRRRCQRLSSDHLADAIHGINPFIVWPYPGWEVRSWEYTDTSGDPFPDPENYVTGDNLTQLAFKGEIVRYVRHTGDWDRAAKIVAHGVGRYSYVEDGESLYDDPTAPSLYDLMHTHPSLINWSRLRWK